MSTLNPLNFKQWIDENRHLLKPPIGNAVVYNDAEFMIMVVGGPNSRTDYHIDPAEEFFYQIEGDMVLKVVEDGEFRDITIREGDIFLLPANLLTNFYLKTWQQSFSLYYASIQFHTVLSYLHQLLDNQ